ncbi:Uncharacterized protein Rs2_10392 [Raphanus sativus]|nr:Uncharacterized protein Rs2_10392 [Raphanus sativus]
MLDIDGNIHVEQVLDDPLLVDSTPAELASATDPQTITSEEVEMDEDDAPFVAPVNASTKEVPEVRKSKRPRMMPAVLQDYKCDPKVTATVALIPDLECRFKLMEETLSKGPDHAVTAEEFCDIAHRRLSLPTRFNVYDSY